MAVGTTKLANIIDPEVMAPIISAKIESSIVVTPFAKIDTTLVGQPGDTVTIPKYAYIGDAENVAEGVECGTTLLTATSSPYKVKKAMKSVTLTDEAINSGYGNPVGETNSQIGKAIASKVDQDAIDVLQTATLKYDGSLAIIGYNPIVNAIDLFKEEINTDKVMFISPSQVTQLRLDPNFISADKYNNAVIMKGEIGMIANARIVASRKIKAVAGKFSCPIMQLNAVTDTEDDTPALTIFLKKDTAVEQERHTKAMTTDITASRFYVASLTNESKVVVASFKEKA